MVVRLHVVEVLRSGGGSGIPRQGGVVLLLEVGRARTLAKLKTGSQIKPMSRTNVSYAKASKFEELHWVSINSYPCSGHQVRLPQCTCCDNIQGISIRPFPD